MKSIEEIEVMLIDELSSHLRESEPFVEEEYYNEKLGDTSFLLAGLLGSHLKLKDNWNSEKWFDDSLLIKLKMDEGEIFISGVMIWGVESTTEQWVSPFHFKFYKSELNLIKYSFLFEDLAKPSIPYEEFKANLFYWNHDEVNWKYIIEGGQKVRGFKNENKK